MTTLDRDTIDRAVSAERLAVAELLADLDDHRLSTPSMCELWTVRDVLAHLTVTTRTGIGQVLRAAVRARGSFDRMELDLTSRQARHPTRELIELLRESATSDRRFPGSSPMDPLMDVVVHAQDVARPLGLVHRTPPAVVAASLSYVAVNRFMGAPRRLRGLRLESADTGWSLGEGPVVRGPDTDLLLAVTGRPAGLVALEGPGLARLSTQL